MLFPSANYQKRPPPAAPAAGAVGVLVTPQSSSSILHETVPRLLFPPLTPISSGPLELLQAATTPRPPAPQPQLPPTTILENLQSLFIFSPFGLSCCHDECPNRPTIELNERSILRHLKKHAIPDCSASVARSLVRLFKEKVEFARSTRTIKEYYHDSVYYHCFNCLCGQSFTRKDSALRHCNTTGCDMTKIQKDKSARKLICGRYVTHGQVDAFFGCEEQQPSRPMISSPIRQQFNYTKAREILEPLLPENEKREHTYTHMYQPLIAGCDDFIEKIKADFLMIHSPPNEGSEALLVSIHQKVETWLLYYAQKNILMVPGNLRAALQTFEGSEVNEVNQKTTYTMQHDPGSLVPELKKLFSFAYRRRMFSARGFDDKNDFEIAYFLKDLLLENPQSVSSVPFLAEFCLMFPFRVTNDGSNINMVSCDTVSSVFSKITSSCKAAVCSVICSFTENAFSIHGPSLVKQIRDAPVLHILSPMVRQIREMNARIPKRRKTTQDMAGNITVDQFYFAFDDWSCIVPRTIELVKSIVSRLAEGVWWEPVVDLSTTVQVEVEKDTGDLLLVLGLNAVWKKDLPLDDLDSFTAILETAFHGFGGGSARMSELCQPSMFHCLFTNDSVYYSLASTKVFNHASKKFKEIERKLPPVIGRYFLLFRLLIRSNSNLFCVKDLTLLLPSRRDRSTYGVSHVIRDLFTLGSLPDMTQVRQFWAGVSNFVTGRENRDLFLTSSQIGADKMGHSLATHGSKYASQRVGFDECHFEAYHFAIGDISYNILKNRTRSMLSLGDIRQAMRLRYPNSDPARGRYLSLQQKELVEFGYGGGPGSSGDEHCLGLLAPGDGKSETYLIPTIARRLANKSSKMIIHISPYSFLARYQFSNACNAIDKLSLDGIVILTFNGRDIHEGNLPEQLGCVESLPNLLFLNLDAMYNLFHHFLRRRCCF